MCLIFFSLNNHVNYKLILAANRDEFYARKTQAADFWSDHPAIVGGRDLEAAGTWLAMNKNGRLSMVTNYRDFKNLKQTAPSRGALVTDFLISTKDEKSYLNDIQPTAHLYNGFNLLVGTPEQLWYLSNYKEGIHKIESGIHGLSNALLDTSWPKVEKGKREFAEAVKEKEVNEQRLFSLLTDEQRAPDELLPETGVGLERERMLSSMFIKSPNYGTRCSTVILVDKNNNVLFSERVYDLQTFEFKEKTFQFTITP